LPVADNTLSVSMEQRTCTSNKGGVRYSKKEESEKTNGKKNSENTNNDHCWEMEKDRKSFNFEQFPTSLKKSRFINSWDGVDENLLIFGNTNNELFLPQFQ
jgi:hypothetical protein